MLSVGGNRLVRFGPFELNPETGELRKRGVRVRLPDQSIKVLMMLVQRPGELVTREELRQSLWTADTFVDFDHGLNLVVARLRQALGDKAERPQYVETLPRKGYRFVAGVTLCAPATTPNGFPLSNIFSEEKRSDVIRPAWCNAAPTDDGQSWVQFGLSC